MESDLHSETLKAFSMIREATKGTDCQPQADPTQAKDLQILFSTQDPGLREYPGSYMGGFKCAEINPKTTNAQISLSAIQQSGIK